MLGALHSGWALLLPVCHPEMLMGPAHNEARFFRVT